MIDLFTYIMPLFAPFKSRLDQSVCFVRIRYQRIILSLESAELDGKTKDIFEWICSLLVRYIFSHLGMPDERSSPFSHSYLNRTHPTRATLLITLPFYRLTVTSFSFFLILFVYNIGMFIMSLVYMIPENIKCWKAYRESFEAVHCNRKR